MPDRDDLTLLRLIADNVADVIMLQRGGVLQYVSPSVTALLGWNPDELVGRSPMELVHPDDWDVNATARKDLQAGRDSRARFRIRTSGGTWLWVESHAQPVAGEHGEEAPGVLSVIRDISAEMDAEEKERRQLQRIRMRERMSTALAEADLDVDTLLNRIGDLALQDFADLASVGLVDDAAGVLRQAVLRHRDPEVDEQLEAIRDTVVRRGEGLAGRVWNEGQPLVLLDVDSEEFQTLVVPEVRPFFQTYELRGMLIMPLRVQGVIKGTLTVSRSAPSPNFDEADVSLLREMADTCAMALANAQLHTQLQQSEAQFRLLASNAADMVLLLRDFRIAWASPSVARFGWKPEDMLGTPTLEFAHADDIPVINAARADQEGREVVRLRFRFRHGDGRYSWVESQTAVAGDSAAQEARVGGLVVSIRDIDEQVRADLALRESGDELADANESLSRLNRDLQRSNRDLEEFARVASHDLKTPLRQAASLVELATMEVEEGNRNDAKDLLGSARRALSGLHTLIADLLEFARQGASDSSCLDSVAIERACADLRPAVASLDGEILVPSTAEYRVAISSTQLQQVLRNLLDNSLKYRTPDVPPRIVIETSEQDGQWCCRVTDNGIGVDATHHERVFDLFYRDEPSEGVDGTGLGLALCRKIVEQAGGGIRMTAPENAPGTCMELLIPLAQAEPGT